ncbi:MAG: stage II sporulation protein R [Hydrogenibacillus sp.]|nr:stage II sporulation protein R [Hydrogenibacillus sp.]
MVLGIASFVAATLSPPIPNGALRLRIVAHSDHPLDQAIKEDVRRSVVQTLVPIVEGAPDDGEAVKAAVRGHLAAIAAAVWATLREDGAPYGARLEFGRLMFPAKVYGDRFYPEAPREALVITLGEGRGHNMWCVFFPSLCMTKESIRPKRALADNEAHVHDAVPRKAALQNGAPSDPAREDVPPPGDARHVEIRFFFLDVIRDRLGRLWP